MVCIAAFIILGLAGIFVAIVSIFKREVGRAYLKLMKKSWGCVGKKVRLQKCDTNFKEDVKNTLLRKIVLTHPKLLVPLSNLIEALSVIVVVVFAWAVLTSLKSLLALWSLGTCNVDRPAACTLSSEACSLGDDFAEKTLGQNFIRWFTEWGDIAVAIPDRLKSWNAEEYYLEPVVFIDPALPEIYRQFPDSLGFNPSTWQTASQKPSSSALDIVDPGCSACMMSFRNQLSSGFVLSHYTAVLVYPIQLSDGSYKFPNSGLFARYFYATALLDDGETAENQRNFSLKLLNRIFTEKTADGIIYQSYYNSLSESEAKAELKSWLRDFGASEDDLKQISALEKSDEVKTLLEQAKELAETKVHIKGIPTLLYNNRKHFGLYEAQ